MTGSRARHAVYRADILRYASGLLDRDGRDAARVTAVSQALLDWADRAPDSGDLACRMTAMERAHLNIQDRIWAARGKPRPTAEEFTAEAAAYYEFIRAALDPG